MNEILVLSGYVLWAIVAFVVLSGIGGFIKEAFNRRTLVSSLRMRLDERNIKIANLKDDLDEINMHLRKEQADYLKMHRRAQKFESKAAFWKRAHDREKAKHAYFVSVVLDAHDLLPTEITGDTLDLVGNLRKFMLLHEAVDTKKTVDEPESATAAE